MVVDPTIILALTCFPAFISGMVEAMGFARLRAPDTIIQDTLSICVTMERAGQLTSDEVHRVMLLAEGIPLQLVPPNYSFIYDEFLSWGIPIRAACYLDVARHKPSVMMSFDNALIRYSRTLRIPRCRFARDYRMQVKSKRMVLS